MGIGQNMAGGYGSWEGAIRGWYGEVEDYDWSSTSNDYMIVGHYTQVGAFFAFFVKFVYFDFTKGTP